MGFSQTRGTFGGFPKTRTVIRLGSPHLGKPPCIYIYTTLFVIFSLVLPT